MIAILTLVIQVLMALITPVNSESVTIPPMPAYAPEVTASAMEAEYESGCICEECIWTDHFEDALYAFDALFNSYETKRAKNGALMIRRGNKGSYKFAKKG